MYSSCYDGEWLSDSRATVKHCQQSFGILPKALVISSSSPFFDSSIHCIVSTPICSLFCLKVRYHSYVRRILYENHFLLFFSDGTTQLKSRFLSELTALIAGSNTVTGSTFLEAVFTFCCCYHQSSKEPEGLFTSDQRKWLEKEIFDTIPLLEIAIKRLNALGIENVKRLRSIRSGLQFIKDDFDRSNGWLDRELKDLLAESGKGSGQKVGEPERSAAAV